MVFALSDFRDALGPAAYEDDDVLLYQGDCLELMAALPAGSAPLTVTSPPYNIGKAYEVVTTPDDYKAWTARWTALAHRLATGDGSFWLNLGYAPLEGRAKAMPLPYLLWDCIPFFLVQEVVWNYGAGVAGKRFFSPRNEKLLWYVKDPQSYVFNLDDVRDPDVLYPNQKKNGRLRCNPLGKNPSDVWRMPKVTSGRDRASPERTPHPAQFPVQLVERAIRASSHPGQVVLDPFAGSASTLEAAIRCGRKAVGIEIKAEYVDIARRRLQRLRAAGGGDSQPALFPLRVSP